MSKAKPTPDELPEVLDLFDVLSKMIASASGFSGVVVRSVPTKYANKKDFFSGAGAAKSGGRWNPVGLPAVYCSLDVITATYEAYQNINLFGFPMTAIEPRVMAGAKVSLGKVFDLTDRNIRARIRMTLTDLINEDWEAIQASGKEARTQAIGRGCMLAGYEGLLVPSARNRKGRNLVIFVGNLSKSSDVCLLAADKLPK